MEKRNEKTNGPFKHKFDKKQNRVEFEIKHENEIYKVEVEFNDNRNIDLKSIINKDI